MRWRGNWFLALCFLAILGCVGMALGPDFVAAARTYTWRATPCLILRSAVAEERFSRTVTHFVLKVEYSYSFEGREYRCTRFTSGDWQGSTDLGKAERAAVRFKPGVRATCYVNPRNPGEAVLERGELWGGLFLLAPFLIAALVMHESIFEWFESRRIKRRASKNIPLSERNDAFRTDGRLILFGGIGLILGALFLGFCLVEPLLRWSKSRHWAPAQAIITRCEVSSHSTQHGPSYSLELTYEYEFGGGRYRSDRRCFGNAIDEPVTDISAWADAHPPGSSIVCYVDPNNPTEAVLERRPKIGWVPLAVGGLMLGFGMFMLARMGRTMWMRRNLVGARLTEHCLGTTQADTRLLRSRNPLLIACAYGLGSLPLIPAAAWSLHKGIRALLQGQGDIINLLYGSAAGTGAVWLLYQCVRFILRSRHAVPVLRLTPGTPAVGDRIQVEWEFPSSKNVSSLSIWIEGAEEAKVRHVMPGLHGAVSEEKTQRSTFSTVPLIETASPHPFGNATVLLPNGVMHSFRGEKCGVAWQIKVRLSYNGNTHLDYGFPITVRPGKR